MTTVFAVAEGTGTPVARVPAVEMPWTWARVFLYIRRIRQVFEAAAKDPLDPKTAVPPRHFFLEDELLEQWFSERREAYQDELKRARENA